MPRPKYPSDDPSRRGFRPHTKIHLSWANHPRWGEAAGDALYRGAIVGIWMVATRAFAGRTGDMVTLSQGDVEFCGYSGATNLDARDVVLRACALMGWKVEETGQRIRIHIRNFAKKQGFTPRDSGGVRADSTDTPHALRTNSVRSPQRKLRAPNSDSDSDSDSNSEKNSTIVAGEGGLGGEPSPAAPAESPPARSRSLRRKTKTEAPSELSHEEKADLIAWIETEIRKGVLPASFRDKVRLRRMVGICLNHFKGNGDMKADWPATVRNWITREAHPGPKAGNGRARELPQMPLGGRDQGAELAPLGDAKALLRLVED